MKKIAMLFVTSFSLFLSNLHSQSVLLSWDIPTSAAPNSGTSPTSVTSSANDPSVNASTIYMGPGIIGAIGNSSTGWGASSSWGGTTTANQTLDYNNNNGDWFNFSVTAKPGKIVTINGIGTLILYASGAGPGSWGLLSSTNTNSSTGFSTNGIFYNGTPRQSSGGSAYTLESAATFSSALAASNVVIGSGKTVYFRLVGFNGFNTGSGRIVGTNTSGVDFTLLGTVADAPIQTFTWNGGSAGNWNYLDTNWLDGSASSSAYLADNNAQFTNGATVLIQSAGVSVGFLTNNLLVGETTILSGGSLSSSSIINSGAGDLEIQSTNSASTIVNTGSGKLSLSAPGTYTLVGVSNGSIATLADKAISGAVNVSGGGVLNVSAFSNSIGLLTVSNGSVVGTGILTASGSSFTLDSGNQTVPVSIRGSGSLTKAGLGALTLSGSNAFSGDVNLNAGTLATSGNDRIPDTAVINLSTNAIFRLGGNETVKSIAGTTAAAATIDLQNYTLTLNATASNSYSSAIVGNGGSMVKNGTSVLTINENNTFTGGTTLNNGSFRLQASGNRTTNGDGSVTLASSPFGVGTLTITGGKIFSSGTSGRTIYNNVNIAGSFINGDTSLTQNGDITVSTNVTGAMTTLSADASITVDAALDWQQTISGGGKTLTKLGLANMHLRSPVTLGGLVAGAGNLYVRNTNDISSVVVQGGAVLGYGSSNVLSSSYFGAATLILSNGATLGQFAQCGTGTDAERTIANNMVFKGDVTFGLGTYGNFFTGNVDLDGGTRAIILTNSTSLGGVVSNGSLVLSNTSATRTLSLNGNNTYAGGTTQNGGVISLGHNNGLGTGDLNVLSNNPYTNVTVSTNTNTGVVSTNTNVVVASNTLAVSADRTVTNTINLAPGAVFTMDTAANSWTHNGAITGVGGSVVKTGSGNLRLNGSLNFIGGSTTVANGTLVVSGTGYSATITTNAVAINFTTTPNTGTYMILPGPLTGSYPSSSVSFSGLAANQSATFTASTGTAEVAQVTVQAPANLSYGSTELSATNKSVMTTVTPTCDNSPTSYSITPDLPSGLTFNTVNGSIGGTPDVASPRSLYTVKASNTAGDTTRTIYLTVAKATPSISVAPTATAITFGQALSSSTLSGGTGSVDGTFAWTDSTITPAVGTGNQSVIFTPTDTANYNTATTDVSVTVNAPTPTGPSLTDAYPGSTPLGVNPQNGLTYLMSYALGGDSSNAPILPSQVDETGKLVLVAVVRTNDTNVSVVGEAVGSLADYANPSSITAVNGTTNDVLQTNLPAGCERRKYSVDQGSNDRQFLRLKAIQK